MKLPTNEKFPGVAVQALHMLGIDHTRLTDFHGRVVSEILA
jgi:hypothetical protein